MKFKAIIKNYNSTFWASNVIELFERWAWYGFYMALALYLVNSKDTGALGFTQAEKGIIMGTGSMLLYFLPLFTGALADKIGYKRMLILSFTIYLTGFIMIKSFNSFGWVFFAFIWICTGGAFFKPIISAMVARTTTPETSSIGFGIFYTMVNIGAFIGPFISGILLGKSWNYVFYLSMGAIGLNYFITFLFFRDPFKNDGKTKLLKSIAQALANIWTAIQNWKYLLFLVIMVLFWTAFNQLYYSFPVFVDQWVDTGMLYKALSKVSPALASAIGTPEGTISAVTISSIDALYIIIFQIMVSTFVMRFRPLSAMTGGILFLSAGLFLMFSNQSGWLILFGVLIFGLGEMACSPKFTEYIGRIAPENQKALYMGTSYLPIGMAHFIAGWLSGRIYEHAADKIYLAGIEMNRKGFSIGEISETFSKNDFLKEASEKMGMPVQQFTDYLWKSYHPGNIWFIYSGIALFAALFLFLYNRFIIRPKENG